MTAVTVVSVPHSGTRFLRDRLGIESSFHPLGRIDHIVERAKGKRLIAPLRNPLAVWRSWARRADPHAPFPYARFFAAWYNVAFLDDLFGIEFVCIEDRSDTRISDWTPVGHDQGHDEVGAAHPPIALHELYYLPFVKAHYDRPPGDGRRAWQ